MDTPTFGAHWRARLNEIRALREERGATDPILIIAGIAITLILLVGGSFAVAGFMNNAKDMNAKSDIDRIAVAMDTKRAMDALDHHAPGGIHFATGDKMYDFAIAAFGYVPSTPDPDAPNIGLTISQGAEAIVLAIPNGKLIESGPDKGGNDADWGAFVRSDTGNWFFRTASMNKVWDFGQLSGDGTPVTPPTGFMTSDLPENVKNQAVGLFNAFNSGFISFE